MKSFLNVFFVFSERDDGGKKRRERKNKKVNTHQQLPRDEDKDPSTGRGLRVRRRDAVGALLEGEA